MWQSRILALLRRPETILRIAAIVVLLVVTIGIEARTNYTLSSTLFSLNRPYRDPELVLVAIDNATLNSPKFPRYSDITRCDIATLLENILASHPKVIGIDIFFSQASLLPVCDTRLERLLRDHSDTIVAGTEYMSEEGRMIDTLLGSDRPFPSLGYVNTIAFNPIQDHLTDMGFPIRTQDYEGAVPLLGTEIRALPLAMEVWRRVHPTMAIAVPSEYGVLPINFFTDTYPTVSFIDVVSRTFDHETLQGKTVFIGATSEDLHDTHLSPVAPSTLLPGVLLHMNLYNTLSSGRYVHYIGLGELLAIETIFLIVLLTVSVTISNAYRSAIASIVVLVLGVVAAYTAFWVWGIFFDPLVLIVGAIGIFLIDLLWKYLQERRKKDHIESIFSRYISPDVVRELIRSGADLRLGGSEREVTLFFSDLVGFTTLSERLSPPDLGKILNTYFESMSSIILEHRGTIDKFIGDAIMVFWNAPLDTPDHATLACRAALRQREALVVVRRMIAEMGYPDIEIDMRIGIHTGMAIIGNFGCSRRYDYTALGDSVNLASRLEGVNKMYGTHIIMSGETCARIDTALFLVRELDRVVVKGKEQPITIFELMGWHPKSSAVVDNAAVLSETKRLDLYRQAFELYREKRFREAREIFRQIDDPPSRSFVKRCNTFLDTPPDVDWNGIFRLESK